MHKLSYLILLIALTFSGFAQSPHGEGFKMDCTVCHTSESWKVLKAKTTFDHDATHFKLSGQHTVTDCSSCHKSLKFQEAKSECVACHTDMHRNTLGQDCARCHSTKAWIIPNTSTMHQQSRFPLQGNHAVVECSACHKSASGFQFEPLSLECVSCHRANYMATTSPNHQKAGYSTNCNECHGVKSTGWDASSFEHGFFPLTGGHRIGCAECHADDTYQKISNDCVTCHQKEYNSTSKPNHQQTRFSTSCAECHTTSPGWNPANFKQHDDQYFPVYSGNHKGEWDRCTDCHTANTYSSFSCIDCHEHTQSKMNKEHEGENGYTYRSVSCYSCHPRGDKSGAFNHNSTNFQLTGKHSTTDCLDCHAKGFTGTSSECSVCHQTSYSNAQTPNHTKAGLSGDCKSCHTTTGWQPSGFKHGSTGFELTGGHAAIVQCSACHIGSTTAAKPDCISCHQVQYTNAKGHVASKFPTDCRNCHTSVNWLKINFNHNTTAFPLTGAHTTATCASCHVKGYTGTSAECKSCHQTNYTTAQTPGHTKAGLPVDCKICHTPAAWQPSSFKHGTTGFELTGAHAAIVQCSACHIGSTTTARPECVSCHQVQYTNAKGHVTSKFPTDCSMCHISANWIQLIFSHNTTAFPLTGAHATATCVSCHSAGYTGTSAECKSCHQTNYSTAQTPGHTAAGLPVDCKICHTTAAWQPSSFKHGSTGFELTGAHAAIVQCSACHVGSTTTAKPECVSCHQVQYTNAKGHVASKFPADCRICHTPANWLQIIFNHNGTAFPLTGAHTTATCASCHSAGYTGTSAECKGCHQTNYNTAQTPGHTAAGLPVDCKICHTPAAWQPSSFKHGTTGFELTGGHAAIVQCSACHVGSTTAAKPECVSCHQVQYTNAKGHVASKFPTDCRICHTPANWLQITFNHNGTAFPLTGAHTTATCASCHSAGYTGTSAECKSCHQTNYNTAQTPGHTAAGLPVDCKICHTPAAWQPSSFKHGTTGFELTGGHAAIVQCSACHVGSTTAAKPECVSCHQVQYTNAKGHVASKFPTDCRMCHTSANWLQITFNHNTTAFPLTGAHTTATCISCHSAGYTGTSTDCNSCHQANYTAATNPNHKTLAIPVTCAQCHSTSPGWQPASFAIHNTYYALTGAHAAIANDCATCHKGVYNNIPKTCYTCHATEYKNTTNPSHATAQFPIDCAICHSSTTWSPSTFNHDAKYFPIYSGKHRGKWTLCSECHTSTSNYAVFSCIRCHEHSNKTAVDGDHRGISGYTYTAISCYTCHPTGNGD